LWAALGRPFRRARFVRFSALAVAAQNLRRTREKGKNNLPK